MLKCLLERKRDGRSIRVLYAPTAEVVSSVTFPSGHGVVLLSAPGWERDHALWANVALNLLHKGMCYCCTWAAGEAEGLHDLVDSQIVDHGFEANRSVIMTTWHDKESLIEAAWFFLYCTEPSPSFESCKDWSAIAVGSEDIGIELMRAVKSQLGSC